MFIAGVVATCVSVVAQPVYCECCSNMFIVDVVAVGLLWM